METFFFHKFWQVPCFAGLTRSWTRRLLSKLLIWKKREFLLEILLCHSVIGRLKSSCLLLPYLVIALFFIHSIFFLDFLHVWYNEISKANKPILADLVCCWARTSKHSLLLYDCSRLLIIACASSCDSKMHDSSWEIRRLCSWICAFQLWSLSSSESFC